MQKIIFTKPQIIEGIRDIGESGSFPVAKGVSISLRDPTRDNLAKIIASTEKDKERTRILLNCLIGALCIRGVSAEEASYGLFDYLSYVQDAEKLGVPIKLGSYMQTLYSATPTHSDFLRERRTLTREDYLSSFSHMKLVLTYEDIGKSVESAKYVAMARARCYDYNAQKCADEKWVGREIGRSAFDSIFEVIRGKDVTIGEDVLFLSHLISSPAYTVPVKKDAKVGRNSPCPCGSGKKYKKCCGKS